MKTYEYEISYTSGGEVRRVDSEQEARTILGEQYPDAEYCENGWESSSCDGSVERLLVWACEDDSVDDGGQNAVAEIVRRAA